MTDRWLRKRYLVTGVRPLPGYNVAMSLTVNEQHHDERVASTPSTANPRGQRARISRAGLIAAAFLATSMIATGCGAGSSPSAAQKGSIASPSRSALAFTNCMRTHGEPNMSEPVIDGQSAHIRVAPGMDPNSAQFTGANNACKHLLPANGVPTENPITPGDQTDYLKATACMRSHGVPDFPDPVFHNNNVAFQTPGTRIDTNSPQYQSAVATCQRLIPRGLPYSSTSNS
jgi:hypothetical protein